MKTPDYIEPMLLAALPYTATGKRDAAAAVAWDIDKALSAAGYVIVEKSELDRLRYLHYQPVEGHEMGQN